MANRYWVGGTDTWDSTAGSKWALTSGGAGGQAVPTTSDTVFFDANSGANTITLGINPTVLAVNCTGFTGTLAFGTQNITCVATSANQFTGVATMTVTGTPVVNINNATSGTIGISTGAVTEANAISFNIISGTGTATIGYTKNLNFTGFAGTLANSTKNIYGNLTISSGMTLTAGTNIVSFVASSSTQQITTNGNSTIDFPIVLGTSTSTNTVQLQDALTVGTTRTVTLTGGNLDLNNLTLTAGLFNASGSNTRSILFGTGNITLTGSGTTIWNSATATNFTYTGTPTINLTYSGATGTRSLTAHGTTGGTETNALSFNVSAGTDIVNGTMVCKNFNLTGFSGTLSNNTKTIYGNLTISSGLTCTAGSLVTTFAATSGTQQITTNGNSTIDFPITFAGTATYQLQDALTIGATRTVTLTSGTLDLNGKTLTCGIFSSNNTNTRSILFGTGNITLTGSGTTIWNTATATGFTYTGTPTVNFTYSGSTGTRTVTQAGTANGGQESTALNMNFTAGSDTITFGGAGCIYRNLDFTGFSGTFANTLWTSVGNLNFSSGMTVSAGASQVSFSATLQNQNITSNGKTFGFGVAFNGTQTYAFQDAFTMGSSNTLTFSSGTIQFKAGTTNTVGSFVTSGTVQKYLQSDTAGAQATITKASGTTNATNIIIQDSNATGGTWNATVSINSGNNTGWVFSAPYWYFVSATENSGLLDQPSVSWITTSSITEDSQLADLEDKLAVFSRSLTETFTSAETEDRTAIFNPTIVENLNPADASTTQTNFNASEVENMVLLDNPISRGWFRITNTQNPNWESINNTQV